MRGNPPCTAVGAVVDSQIVQLSRTTRDLLRVARPALAGSLAVVLLAFGLLAASGPLHQSLHDDRTAGANSCVVCLLANGQAELPSVGPILSSNDSFVILDLLAAGVGVPWGVDSLLPPGRGPPRLSTVS